MVERVAPLNSGFLRYNSVLSINRPSSSVYTPFSASNASLILPPPLLPPSISISPPLKLYGPSHCAWSSVSGGVLNSMPFCIYLAPYLPLAGRVGSVRRWHLTGPQLDHSLLSRWVSFTLNTTFVNISSLLSDSSITSFYFPNSKQKLYFYFIVTNYTFHLLDLI